MEHLKINRRVCCTILRDEQSGSYSTLAPPPSDQPDARALKLIVLPTAKSFLSYSVDSASRGLPEKLQLGRGAVVSDRPMPALINQHDRVGVGVPARDALRSHGGSSGVVWCRSNVGHDEGQG